MDATGLVMNVKTEAAVVVPMQSSMITGHHCLTPYNRNADHEANIITMRIRRSETTATRWRWRGSRQHQQLRYVQSLPPLLQRPQHTPPSPKTNGDNSSQKMDDIGGSSSSSSTRSAEAEKATATATDVLRLMDSLQFPVEADTYVSLLKECTHCENAGQGAMVHAHIQDNYKGSSTGSLANHLLLMYAACGQTDAAHHLFDRMPIRDATTWTALLCALSDSGEDAQVFQVLADMLHAQGWLTMESTSLLLLLLTVVLRSCIRVKQLGLAQQLHGLTIKMAATATCFVPLLQCYAKVGCQESAQKLFDARPPPLLDAAAAWECIISAYGRQGHFQRAFQIFREMIEARPSSNKLTKENHSRVFASILKACIRMGAEQGYGSGLQVHALAIKAGLDSNQLMAKSLVDMYSRFGLMRDAERAFETVRRSKGIDTACCNDMLRGYAHTGGCAEAMRLLYEMKLAGIDLQESMLCQVRIACGS